MNKETYIQSINKQRKEKDEFFKNAHHSPIPHEERDTFTGLKYYQPEPKYRYSLKINEFQNKEKIIMAMSTGDSQTQYIFGFVEFNLDGENYQLQVYTSEKNPDYYFVPFMDKTSNDETYGAGRYSELEPDHENPGSYILDFNTSYSPYCAYNDMYACPIPPKANRLNVKILAGEKIYREY
jgi:uncharacterized protein (DUF1684 family)